MNRTLQFYKWQGAGNDFIIGDNRNHSWNGLTPDTIQYLCNRHFGIGADGLMWLNSCSGYDFEMKYFNADGYEAEMCGNGGRCIVAFAHRLGITGDHTRFLASDGAHEANLLPDGLVQLGMKPVNHIEFHKDGYFLNTGVPHVVVFCHDLEHLDVDALGRKIRRLPRYQPSGTNVNFVEEINRVLHVRTYERGVEAETRACGTGVVASAIAFSHRSKDQATAFTCSTRGGELQVTFNKTDAGYEDVCLTGSAVQVFEGKVTIQTS